MSHRDTTDRLNVCQNIEAGNFFGTRASFKDTQPAEQFQLQTKALSSEQTQITGF